MTVCRLKCRKCAAAFSMEHEGTRCTCGGTLLVEYDLEYIKRSLTKDALKLRETSLWRYRELLPVQDEKAIVTLGEGWTPLLRQDELERSLPLGGLWIKREEQNPTGSFKSRGFTVAVSLLKEKGIGKVAVPSNGNAAVSLAAYAGRAGMEAHVFLPKDTPRLIVEECLQYGAQTCLVDGFIHDAGAIIEAGKREQQWFNVGTLKEPGRVEGKKTMGLELAEQFNWKLPDVVIYPTGGGSGVIGIWKALHELKEMGFIEGDFPRMICVQEDGCRPLVDAFRANADDVSPVAEPLVSAATGMRVPRPPDGSLLLSIIKDLNGQAVAVSNDEIKAAQQTLGSHGLSASPEGAATYAGLLRLCDQGDIRPKDRVVLFNTAHALKYVPCETGSAVPMVRSYEEWRKLKNPNSCKGS